MVAIRNNLLAYLSIVSILVCVQGIDGLIVYTNIEGTPFWFLRYFSGFTFDMIALCLIYVVATWDGLAEKYALAIMQLQIAALIVHLSGCMAEWVIRFTNSEFFTVFLEYRFEDFGIYRLILIGIFVAKCVVLIAGGINGPLRRSTNSISDINDLRDGIIDLRYKRDQGNKES